MHVVAGDVITAVILCKQFKRDLTVGMQAGNLGYYDLQLCYVTLGQVPDVWYVRKLALILYIGGRWREQGFMALGHSGELHGHLLGSEGCGRSYYGNDGGVPGYLLHVIVYVRGILVLEGELQLYLVVHTALCTGYVAKGEIGCALPTCLLAFMHEHRHLICTVR